MSSYGRSPSRGVRALARGSLSPPFSSLLHRAFPTSTSSLSGSSSVLDDLPHHEQTGVPPAAGTDTPAGFDLSRPRTLLRHLQDPHLHLPSWHVAGTKGKGSTASFLAHVCHAAGLRTGLYLSPALPPFSEPVTILARDASGPDEDETSGGPSFGESLDEALPAVRATQAQYPDLSRFEVLTGVAWAHMAKHACDVAVVEAGLGAARDATNVYYSSHDSSTPCGENLVAAVVTDIGPEHMEALGGSLTSIATAKAGCMRAGRPVVIGRQTHHEGVGVEEGDGDGLVGSISPSTSTPSETKVGVDGDEEHRSEVRSVLKKCAEGVGAGPFVYAPDIITVHDIGPIILSPPTPLPSPSSFVSRGGCYPPSIARQRVSLTVGAMGSAPAIHLPEISLQLVGDHQIDNLCTALAALQTLRGAAGRRSHDDDHHRITTTSSMKDLASRLTETLDVRIIAQGVGAAHLPGRFHILRLYARGARVTTHAPPEDADPWWELDRVLRWNPANGTYPHPTTVAVGNTASTRPSTTTHHHGHHHDCHDHDHDCYDHHHDHNHDHGRRSEPSSSSSSSVSTSVSTSSPRTRVVYVVLDGAHTPKAADRLCATLHATFGALGVDATPISVVWASADDKDVTGVAQSLRGLRPRAVHVTSTSVGGGKVRSLPPGTLLAAWQRAGMMERAAKRVVCREQLAASVKVGLHRAVRDMAAVGGGSWW